MLNQVFISYSRTNENFARRLAADLDRDELDVWIDVEDIPPGTNWSNAINEGLNSADAMILIMTPASMASKNVEDEWQYFHSRKMPLIPVLLEPCDNIHYQLARLQYINFIRQDYEAAYDEMLSQLRIAGLDAKRLSDRLAEYEAERERKVAEKERLRRAIAQLEKEQAEIDRLQQQYDALQAAEAEEDMIEEKIQKVQAEEEEYKKVVEQEKKRATADESQQIPLYDKTRPIPVTVHDSGNPVAPPIDAVKQEDDESGRQLSLPVQGAIITGVVIVLILVGAFIATGVLGGDEENSDDGDNRGDTSDSSFGALDGDIPVFENYMALNVDLDDSPRDVEWRSEGDILAIAADTDDALLFYEDFNDQWQQTDSLGAGVARVSWYDRTLALLSEPGDSVWLTVWDIDEEDFLIGPLSLGTCENSVALDYYEDKIIAACDTRVIVQNILEDKDGFIDHEEYLNYTLQGDVVQVMVFDAESDLFGAVDSDGRFYFWEHATAQIDGSRTLLPDGDVRYVSDWLPGDDILVVSGPDHGKVWYVDVEEANIELGFEFTPNIDSEISAIAYSAFDKLAIGHADGQIEVNFFDEDRSIIFKPPTPARVVGISVNDFGELAAIYDGNGVEGFIVWEIPAEASSDEDDSMDDESDNHGDEDSEDM